MERLAIEITVVIFTYFIGYRLGFHACFKFLMDELQKHKKDSD